MLKAVVADNQDAMAEAANRIGYKLGPEKTPYRDTILQLATVVLAPLTRDEPYDFGTSELPKQAVAMAGDIQRYKEFWEAPPVDVAYIHRKIAGLFMLAPSLKAQVNVNELIMPCIVD